jgi:hypothetical protein
VSLASKRLGEKPKTSDLFSQLGHRIRLSLGCEHAASVAEQQREAVCDLAARPRVHACAREVSEGFVEGLRQRHQCPIVPVVDASEQVSQWAKDAANCRENDLIGWVFIVAGPGLSTARTGDTKRSNGRSWEM